MDQEDTIWQLLRSFPCGLTVQIKGCRGLYIKMFCLKHSAVLSGRNSHVRKKKKKKDYLHKIPHSSDNFWYLCSSLHFHILKTLKLCDGRRVFLFQTALCLYEKDRHNEMSLRDILFLQIVLFDPNYVRLRICIILWKKHMLLKYWKIKNILIS